MNTRPRFRWVVICLLAVVISQRSVARAQEAGAVLPDTIALARLVDLSAERLGLDIEYRADQLRGDVTLRLRSGPLNDEQLWMLANQMLASRGFTTVENAGSDVLSVVQLEQAARLVSPIGEPEDNRYAGFISRVFQLEHAQADAVVEAVTPYVTARAGEAATVGRRGVRVADLRPKLAAIESMIRALDAPSGPVDVRRVGLSFLSAEEAATALGELHARRRSLVGQEATLEIIAGTFGSEVIIMGPPGEIDEALALLSELDRRQPVEARTYAPRHFGLSEVASLIEQSIAPAGADDTSGWRLIVDELTGSLIVTATPAQHGQIDALIERLDAVPEDARRATRTFKINNRDVADLAGLIRTLISAGVSRPADRRGEVYGDAPLTTPESPDPARPRGVGAGDALGFDDGPGQGFSINADLATNSIIAVGPPRLLDQVAQLVAQLDVRQPQVMLEVMIISLTEGQSLDLGVELARQINLGGDTILRLSSLFGLGGGGAISQLPELAGAGLTGVLLSPGEFSVLLRALETISDGRTLSRPKLLVNNNTEAVFDSVAEEPFTSTNASDTVATTSFAGYQSAGTQVSVRPQIAEGDHLILEYSIALSSFTGESSAGGIPPPRQQNNVSSQVTIPDAFTVVVGGLELTTEGDAESRIPLIGRIPIIGEAFKNRSRSDSRTRFYVFIRADVLRHSTFEDLKYISSNDAASVRVDDGWPKLAPRLIK